MQKKNDNVIENSKKKEKKNKDKKVSVFKKFFENLKEDYPIFILSIVSFLVISIITFFSVTKNVTIAAFSLNEYEIGQIADRNIVADRTIPANSKYPIAIHDGEKIIRKGFPITEEGYRKLEKMANEKEYIDYRAYANSVLYLLLLMILWTLLYSDVLLGRKLAFKELLLQIIFFTILYSCTLFAPKYPFFAQSPFHLCIAIPTAFVIFLITLLYGEKSALFYSIVLSLGILSAADYNIIVFLFTFCSCFSAARIVRKIETRIDMVFASVSIALLNILFLFLEKILFNESFDRFGTLAFAIAVNGFICGILALGFITPLEQILNTASVFRLMDLSDLNNPTMRGLLLTASGTYNHAMMVATLAENACNEIGANALVARVGAYYHDIGKMDQSEYFVENQTGQNKHDDINPSLSVSVIRSHVKKGVEKAHQLHLPQVIIDIIAEHHGNSVIAYFYNEAKKQNPDANEEDFAYNGVPPTTKESAVVMLADTVEAACRTLEKPSVSRLDKFIQSLIASKLEHHQLDNCNLTFSDLTKIRESFVTILAGYYHSRIEYPDQKDPDDPEEKNKTVVVNNSVKIKQKKK
ncbi:MAG: HDIG domain-containing protein [Treponema sp.]|uniref:HD family phosphohydrolase n=1 Tax=Treponema sp. TaxID=166 RepID=UPI001B6EB52F|nr:HDIG domain-containing metalloprotein [Treponema sp.]MBP5588771.1 HDIG domain-containing protein [Treponema sp.]MCR5386917.1 HDIG domain-containing protein [Treponema sp.]